MSKLDIFLLLAVVGGLTFWYLGRDEPAEVRPISALPPAQQGTSPENPPSEQLGEGESAEESLPGPEIALEGEGVPDRPEGEEALDLANRAAIALGDENYEEALQLLIQAREAGAEGISLGFAKAYMGLGEKEKAIEYADKATLENPENVFIWRTVGYIFYQLGDLAGARDAFETAQSIQPDHAIASALEKVRAEQARERFETTESAHFKVRYEGGAEVAIALKLLRMLEAAYFQVGRKLNVYPERKIEVVLYTGEEYTDVTRSPEWSKGAYDGAIHLPVSGADRQMADLDRVMTHEYVHAAVAHILGDARVPTWLNEGLAIELETEGDAKEIHAFWRQVAEPLSMEELSGPFDEMAEAQSEIAYAQSYVLVHSLVARHKMYRITRLLNEVPGQDFDQTFKQLYFETPQQAMDRALADAGGGWSRR